MPDEDPPGAWEEAMRDLDAQRPHRKLFEGAMSDGAGAPGRIAGLSPGLIVLLLFEQAAGRADRGPLYSIPDRNAAKFWMACSEPRNSGVPGTPEKRTETRRFAATKNAVTVY